MFCNKFCTKTLELIFLSFFATIAVPMASKIPTAKYIPTAAQLGLGQRTDRLFAPEASQAQMSLNNMRGLQSGFVPLTDQSVQLEIWTTQTIRPAYEQLNFARSGAQRGIFRSTTPRLMSHQEAAYILGVSQDASPEQVKIAYRKAALKAHPDAGGSTKAMQNINDAKKTLLQDWKPDFAASHDSSYQKREESDWQNERESTKTNNQKTEWYEWQQRKEQREEMERMQEKLKKMKDMFKNWGEKKENTSWSSKFLFWKRERERQQKERQQKKKFDDMFKNWGQKKEDTSWVNKFYSWFKK